MIGRTLAHYEIISQLGKGGMGEVYLADDTTLDRKVALKFLPDAFTGDAERMARFEREAKLLASLNHPNIAGIHGLEQADGNRFLVLEYVEGETLQARLSKGALPLEEALAVCRQITEGLEAAHEKGVIHRDLKPANVMITNGDKVKILDFGLAKALADEIQSIDSSHSPTITQAMTQPGVVLGTAAYMSPEQAKGKSVDKRADIWSFGCILYECLTGKRVFEGETITETLAAILKGEPDWQALPMTIPPNIRFVLRRCLEKDMSRRFRSAADLRILIEEGMSFSLSSEVSGAEAGPRAGLRRILTVAVVCSILVSVATGIVVWRLKSASEFKPISRLSITLPPKQLLQAFTPILALSPDGTKLAYVSHQGGAQQIFLRRLDSFETKPVTGTEGGENPFFSPDSQWLGFVAGRELMKVSIQGGAPHPLTDTDIPWPQGISWGENDMIVMAPAFGRDGLVQISEKGGSSTRVTHLDIDSQGHRFPQFLPGGQAVLYTDFNRNMEDSRIMVHSLKTGEQKLLVKGGTDGRYVPTGHLVYARQGNLVAVSFDAERLEVEGTHVPILEGVMQSTDGVAHFSFSALGSLAYVPGGFGGNERDLVWVDRNGKEQLLGVPPDAYRSLRISPDGKRIVMVIARTNSDIYTYAIPSQKWDKLTFQGINIDPLWTPDGKRITFRADLKGTLRSNLFWMPADGSEEVKRLFENEYSQTPTAWSPDGELLIFQMLHPTNGWDIWVLPLYTEREAYPLVDTEFNEELCGFSPDGRWITYTSDESGKWEIYVQPFAGSGRVRQISTDGGTDPIWVRSGLFYRNGDKMMAVNIETSPTFKKGVLEELFETRFDPEVHQAYDVTPDGKRFLIIKPGEMEQINIVTNWFEELKQKVPVP